MKSPSNMPIRKIQAVSLSGAIVTILVWAAPEFTGVEIPADVAVAFTWILTTAAGYFVPPAAEDITVMQAPEPGEQERVIKRDVIK